jgi:phytoene/squalene synthetase
MSKSIQYCKNMVRLNDHEHYLTSLCSSQFARPAIWAIRAFNIETSQIQDLVTNTTIGRMRLEWQLELI